MMSALITRHPDRPASTGIGSVGSIRSLWGDGMGAWSPDPHPFVAARLRRSTSLVDGLTAAQELALTSWDASVYCPDQDPGARVEACRGIEGAQNVCL